MTLYPFDPICAWPFEEQSPHIELSETPNHLLWMAKTHENNAVSINYFHGWILTFASKKNVFWIFTEHVQFENHPKTTNTKNQGKSALHSLNCSTVANSKQLLHPQTSVGFCSVSRGKSAMTPASRIFSSFVVRGLDELMGWDFEKFPSWTRGQQKEFV